MRSELLILAGGIVLIALILSLSGDGNDQASSGSDKRPNSGWEASEATYSTEHPLTRCDDISESGDCKMDDLETILALKVERWTKTAYILRGVFGKHEMLLTHIRKPVIVAAARLFAVQGHLTESEAQSRLDDTFDQLYGSNQTAFLATFPNLDLSDSTDSFKIEKNMELITDDSRVVKPVRYTDGVNEAQQGYIHFPDIIREDMSSYTVNLAYEHHDTMKKAVFNYDNTDINFARIINKYGIDDLREMASSGLESTKLSMDLLVRLGMTIATRWVVPRFIR